MNAPPTVSREKVYRGVGEIATRTNESEDRTWRLIKDGVLPVYRHTKRGGWRMREGDYLDYLDRILGKPAA